MDKIALSKYFNLGCNNDFDIIFKEIETEYSIHLPDEYKFIIQRFCFHPHFSISTFFVEREIFDGKRYFLGIGDFLKPKTAFQLTQILFNSENDIKKYDEKFVSYNLKGCIQIAELIGFNSGDFQELFINCTESEERGSLYIFDRNFAYDTNEVRIPYEETGIPLKIKIADSITHLLEIVESQKGEIPQEYIIL